MMNMETLKKMNFEEGSEYLKENGFWQSDAAVDESAKVADVYFTNEDDETISFVTVYSRFETAEDGSPDFDIKETYWEEL